MFYYLFQTIMAYFILKWSPKISFFNGLDILNKGNSLVIWAEV